MSFDYSIKPCTSAQPVKDDSGNIIQPVKYNGVGCPAVILSKDNMICNNGNIFKVDTALAPCSQRNTKTDCISSDYNQVLCSWNENNSTCGIDKLSNSYNKIRFYIGETVFVEDILSNIRSLIRNDSMETFLTWNPNLISELANITKGCGSSTSLRLKGKIQAITGNNLDNGRIKWGDIELYKNPIMHPNHWPREIFWLELFNGEEMGLERFNIGNTAGNVNYQEQLGEEWIDKINLGRLFGGRALFPVLREQITNLQTRMTIQKTSTINRSQIMNTPRFRRTGSCGTGSLCLDTTLTPSFKNSTKNMYLAPIPYGQRLGNTFRSSQLRGTKKIVRKNCVDPQFGRLVGTGGARLVNKF